MRKYAHSSSYAEEEGWSKKHALGDTLTRHVNITLLHENYAELEPDVILGYYFNSIISSLLHNTSLGIQKDRVNKKNIYKLYWCRLLTIVQIFFYSNFLQQHSVTVCQPSTSLMSCTCVLPFMLSEELSRLAATAFE